MIQKFATHVLKKNLYLVFMQEQITGVIDMNVKVVHELNKQTDGLKILNLKNVGLQDNVVGSVKNSTVFL